MADEEKSIFIDEDWKAQVQKEKEEAAQKAETAEAEADNAGEGDEATGPGQQPEPGSFSGLVQSLATQAMLALGLIAPPDQQQVMVDIVGAKYMIDTLDMLKEKTEGNLTEDESKQLTEVLAELQRFYVVRAQQVQEASLQQAGVDMNNIKAE
jgi:hypothetical protein